MFIYVHWHVKIWTPACKIVLNQSNKSYKGLLWDRMLWCFCRMSSTMYKCSMEQDLESHVSKVIDIHDIIPVQFIQCGRLYCLTERSTAIVKVQYEKSSWSSEMLSLVMHAKVPFTCFPTECCPDHHYTNEIFIFSQCMLVPSLPQENDLHVPCPSPFRR